MRLFSSTAHSEARPPPSAWAARPAATSAPAFAYLRRRLRPLHRRRCVAATFVCRSSVPARCHFLQTQRELPQAPAVTHEPSLPPLPNRSRARTAALVKNGLALEAPARVNVGRFVGAAAKGGSELVARQRPLAQFGSANSPPPASHHARPRQGTIAPVRPNPSFNLTFSGRLRQPPNAS
jgi:hypothetical protein